MSGFSASWLRLREPADHQARDAGLAASLATYLAGREAITLLDLGCGSGSNLRALAPALPMRQHWRLVDHDPALLEAARSQIDAWQRNAKIPGLTFEFIAADLHTRLPSLFEVGCDVVTASALFDLVSTHWMGEFVAMVVERGCAFYTVLIYDGGMRWQPAHPADAPITAAFNAHQRRDKGFGFAAGPDAGRHLAASFENAGYRVEMAPSPWRLAQNDLPLIGETAEGVARAADELQQIPEADIASWLSTRQDVTSCEVGHIDLLALP